MEVKRGYKKTDVGIIPESWEVGNLCDLVKHGPQNGYSGRSGKDIRGTATLSLAATSSGRLVLNDATVKYLEYTIPADSPLFLEPGDVLVQRSNTFELVGTTAIFNGPTATYIYPDLMMRLRFKRRITAEWFWRYANSNIGRCFFRSVAAGSTGSMPKISGERLRQMLIAIPPITEQEAITDALSDTDALIESLEQLIAQKRHLKQGAMQELLTGKKRLPGFEVKRGNKQTEIGAIPEDWVLDYIENLAQITTGGRNTQDRVHDGQYPFFVRSQTVERINSYSYDGEAVLTAGDGVGTGKVFHYINGKFDAHQRVYRISEFSEQINGCFFFLYFSTHFYSRIMQMTAKSSVDSVRREMIARMRVPLPPTRAEQEAIAAILSDMDAEIVELEGKLAKARQIKQGMMQELLTGRIRLIG
jgi:type I restriction enzyme, S subunit